VYFSLLLTPFLHSLDKHFRPIIVQAVSACDKARPKSFSTVQMLCHKYPLSTSKNLKQTVVRCLQCVWQTPTFLPNSAHLSDSRFITVQGHLFTDVVFDMAEHNNYHMGQIVSVRSLNRSFKKPTNSPHIQQPPQNCRHQIRSNVGSRIPVKHNNIKT
jgi:hypothetical protein